MDLALIVECTHGAIICSETDPLRCPLRAAGGPGGEEASWLILWP
jgi:hypothetical protein